jgi:glutamine phosphoribosylpyrophosphate amidotransferase
MCGIVGIVNPEGLKKADLAEFCGMMARAEIRGTCASGVFNSEYQVVKSPGSFRKGLFRQKKFAKWLKRSLGTKFVVGHTRMATQGTPRKNSNNHPFSVKTRNGMLILVHNGMVWTKFLHKTDTLQLVADIKKLINTGFKFPDFFRFYNEMIDGQAVLVTYHNDILALSRTGWNKLVFDDSQRFFASTGSILGKKVHYELYDNSYCAYTF